MDNTEKRDHSPVIYKGATVEIYQNEKFFFNERFAFLFLDQFFERIAELN